MLSDRLCDFHQFVNHLQLPISFFFSDEIDSDGDSYLYMNIKIGDISYFESDYKKIINELSKNAVANIKGQIDFAPNRKRFIESINSDIEKSLNCFNIKHIENQDISNLPKKAITLFYLYPDEVGQIPESDYLNSVYYKQYINVINYQYSILKKFNTSFNKYVSKQKLRKAERRTQTFIPKFIYSGTPSQEDAFRELLNSLKCMRIHDNKAIIAPQTQISQLKQVFGLESNNSKMIWYSKGDLQSFTKGIKKLLINKPIFYDWQSKFELVGSPWKNFNCENPTNNKDDINSAIAQFERNIISQ